MEYRYTAIVLGKRDVGETDRIYTLFTREEGSVRVKGVGVRKPNAKLAGHLETGMLSAVTVMKRRGMGRIVGSVCERTYIPIDASYENAHTVLATLSEFSRMVEEGEKDEVLFDLLFSYMEAISSIEKRHCADRMSAVSLGFRYQLIRHLGAAPEIVRCVNCETSVTCQTSSLVSIERGGVICSLCKDAREYSIRMDRQSLRALAIMANNRIASLEKLTLGTHHIRTIGRVLDAFAERMSR